MKASTNIFPYVQFGIQGADPSPPAAGDVMIYAKSGGLYTQNSSGTVTPIGGGGGGSGTVTSVALTMPGVFSVAGSPITSSGTFAVTLAAQSANRVWAGPTTGTAAAPTFRALVPADLPVMVASGASHAGGAVPDPGATAGTTKYLREDGTWQAPTATLPGTAYMALQCALMEPDAIEALQKDTFSYAIGSTTKYVIASWSTQIGTSGRSEVRDPHKPMALNNVTYTGSAAGATAVILNPALATYSDPWTTYYARKLAIDSSPVQTVNVSGASQHIPFLTGAYGAIVTQVTCFDLAWVIWRIGGTWGPNLANEISDTATQRVGNGLCMPINKAVSGEIETSSTGSGTGSVSYVLLPSTWSVIPDPLAGTYLFRDDFMGASLDTTTKWTRTQSTVGNVEINTKYQWCSLTGSSSWGANSMLCKTSFARAAGRVFLVDVFGGRGAYTNGLCIVGWSDGAGQAQSNFAHGVNFNGSGSAGILQVYENNTNRGTVGTGWTNGGIYRIRITLTTTGATYEIQGGKEYPPLGGATWTNITPGTTSSATATLYPAAAAWFATAYISDVRVY